MQKGSLIQWGFKPRLNEVKPPVDASDFKENLSSELDKNPGRKFDGANLINN